MSKKDNKKSTDDNKSSDFDQVSIKREFKLEDASPGGNSSEQFVHPNAELVIDETDGDLLSLDEIADEVSVDQEPGKSALDKEENLEGEKEKDPIFKKLSEPKLPDLPKENRARLQMQSPTRIYFYWSIKNNPFQTLNKALGGRIGSYTLVTKLVNRTKNIEELFPVEPEGNWWFTVEADSNYRAEIGFYAPNRPFVRVIFSNELRTPRKSPSKRRDYTPSFNVDAYQFAEVLDAAGYKRDAFEVAVAGDDEALAHQATQKTYSKLTGQKNYSFDSKEGDELRFVLLAFASGYSLEDVRGEINTNLFSRLERELEKFTTESVLSALKENFDVFTDEYIEEEEIGAAVFGASLVNFPKRLKKRSVPKTLLPKLSRLSKINSISSFGLK